MTMSVEYELRQLAEATSSRHVQVTAQRALAEIEYLRAVAQLAETDASRWRKLAVAAANLAEEVEKDSRTAPAPAKPGGKGKA